MRIPILGWTVDERYLNHRLRASSLGGIAGGLVAVALLGYRFYVNHFFSWDLAIVVATIIGVKLALMAWALFRE